MNLNKLIDIFKKDFSLEYYIYNKSDLYYLPFSVRLSIKFNNETLYCWGVDKSEDLAFYKALMEMIERLTFHSSNPTSCFSSKFGFKKKHSVAEIEDSFSVPVSYLIPRNTNGMAINNSKRKAMRSSFHELVERHTLLASILLHIPPRKIKHKISQYKLPRDYSIAFYYWELGNTYISLCMVKDPLGGYIFSHACHSNLKVALEKSFYEVSPNIIFSLSEQNKPINFKIQKDDIPSFATYWKNSKDDRMEAFLESQSKEKKDLPSLMNVYYLEYQLPESFRYLKDDLFVTRAISPQAQQLFFDEWKEIYVNPLILPRISNLPSFPHPIS